MTKKRALGKGLDALIPTSDPLTVVPAPSTSGVQEVPPATVAPNPHQPRQHMDPQALEELAASIREHGLIQPLIVSEAPEDADPGVEYVLIAGERRLEASKLAGLGTVQVIVKEATPQQMLELALVENIQRADLNPLEEATAYQHLVQDFGLTQQQIAGRVGKNRVSVANALRLLRLPAFCKSILASGQITEGHARALLGLEEDEGLLKRAVKTVISQSLSVRQTEELVRRLRASPTASRDAPAASPETQALETEFSQALGTKVQLSRSKKGGRLTIHFYSEEELQGLYDILVAR